MKITIPRRWKGRPTRDALEIYERGIEAFCKGVKEIQSRLDLVPSSRGWCYLMEAYGLRKGDFDRAQALIVQCLKDGLLPMDIVAEDGRRAFHCVEELHHPSPYTQAAREIYSLLTAWKDYQPFSFWDDHRCFIQMLVEKVDLLTLFSPICEDYHIPIANQGGWSNVSQRAAMMTRFKFWEEQGKQCVLLQCGDFDPGGFNISETLRSNIEEVAGAVGWSPDNLIIDRFGLNFDLIKSLGLTWIESLETGSGGDLGSIYHKDHSKRYVQEYRRFMLAQGFDETKSNTWKRKCEANALIVRPVEGRQLCLDAVHKYVPRDAVAQYKARLKPYRINLQKEIKKWLKGIYGK